MRNGAYAEICGELKEDIVIKGAEDGIICGLINILTNSVLKPNNNPKSKKQNHIPVLLMGVDIIKKHGGSLKKGEKVWLVGKFEVIENAYIAFERFGFDNINGVIISLHDKNRLRIITHDPALNIILQQGNKVTGTAKACAMPGSWASNFS